MEHPPSVPAPVSPHRGLEAKIWIALTSCGTLSSRTSLVRNRRILTTRTSPTLAQTTDLDPGAICLAQFVLSKCPRNTRSCWNYFKFQALTVERCCKRRVSSQSWGLAPTRFLSYQATPTRFYSDTTMTQTSEKKSDVDNFFHCFGCFGDAIVKSVTQGPSNLANDLFGNNGSQQESAQSKHTGEPSEHTQDEDSHYQDSRYASPRHSQVQSLTETPRSLIASVRAALDSTLASPRAHDQDDAGNTSQIDPDASEIKQATASPEGKDPGLALVNIQPGEAGNVSEFVPILPYSLACMWRLDAKWWLPEFTQPASASI
jgi:hypothetical protein